jgi:hypothetical protein
VGIIGRPAEQSQGGSSAEPAPARLATAALTVEHYLLLILGLRGGQQVARGSEA